MPTYLHVCHECNKEWEDMYSMKQDPPDTCPNCGCVGKVERLIYGGSGRGIVERTGEELKEKTKNDSKELMKEMLKDEKLLANLVGEEKYHQNQLNMSRDVYEGRRIQKELNIGKIHRK